MCVCNFTPVVRQNYRVGVPGPGLFRERINTDSQHYGGSDVGNAYGIANAEEIPAHQHAWSVSLTIPPLATVYFEWEDVYKRQCMNTPIHARACTRTGER